MAMARKKRMFKSLANAHHEDVGTGGNWNSIAYIEKQQGQFTSAYVDKVRISYILKDEMANNPAAVGGLLFCASNSATLDSTTASNNDDNIISASAGRLGGGVVSLSLKRIVRENEADDDSGQGRIYLFVRSTDMDSTDTVDLHTITECWGRWHKVVSL